MSIYGEDFLPNTTLTLQEATAKLSGLHFSKEALSPGEREILYIAEALLRQVFILQEAVCAHSDIS